MVWSKSNYVSPGDGSYGRSPYFTLISIISILFQQASINHLLILVWTTELMSNLWQYGWGLLGCQLFLDGRLNKFPRGKVIYIIVFFETFLSFHWVCKTLLIDKIPKQFTRWIIMFFPTMIPLQSPSPSWTSFCLVIFFMKAEHPHWGGRFWELATILFWLSSEAAFVLLLV